MHVCGLGGEVGWCGGWGVKREREKESFRLHRSNALAHRIKGLSRTRTSKFKFKTLHTHKQIPKMEPIAGNIAAGYF